MATTKIWKVVKRMDHVIGYAKDEKKTKIEFNQKDEILVDDLQNVIDYARNSIFNLFGIIFSPTLRLLPMY